MPVAKGAPAPILVIDDEEQTLLSVGFTLSANGLPRAVGCGSGRQAMAILAAEPCSVVLLDLSLPGTSGTEILAWIRRNMPGLPVIVLTADGSPRTRQSCMRGGAFDYLVKPVDEDSLVGAVRRALGETGQTGSR
jgi:DNA-binding NtrC family response regulator